MSKESIAFLAEILDRAGSKIVMELFNNHGYVNFNLIFDTYNDEEAEAVARAKEELASKRDFTYLEGPGTLKLLQPHIRLRRRQADLAMQIIYRQNAYLKSSPKTYVPKNKCLSLHMDSCLVNMYNESHQWDTKIIFKWHEETFMETGQESAKARIHRFGIATPNDWRILEWYLLKTKKTIGVTPATPGKAASQPCPYLWIQTPGKLEELWFQRFGGVATQQAEELEWRIPFDSPNHAIFWAELTLRNLMKNLPSLTEAIPEHARATFV